MPVPDLDRLPVGERGWAALLAYVTSTDDRVERYFLELKSEVDLNTTHGRHKVAKFILGAANRPPDRASRRFGGHAVMFIGVAPGSAHGIEGFEALELERDVARFTGAPGPGWDYHRIPVTEGRDVIAIVVDPPTRVWPCLADGQGLNNGDIYIRADGETRKATGAEIAAMFARNATLTRVVDVEVTLDGEIHAVIVDTDALTSAVNVRANKLLGATAGTAGSIRMAPSYAMERRSRDEFLTQVEQWRTERTHDVTPGVLDLIAATCGGLRVRVRNNARTFLEGVRVEIIFDDHLTLSAAAGSDSTEAADATQTETSATAPPAAEALHGQLAALDWQNPDDARDVQVLAGVPKKWGTDSFADLLTPHLPSRPTTSDNGYLLIHQVAPPRLRINLDTLHPDEEYVGDDDDVVLTALITAPPAAATPATEDVAVTGHWRLTAAGIDDVFEGDLTLPVRLADWRAPLAQLLGKG